MIHALALVHHRHVAIMIDCDGPVCADQRGDKVDVGAERVQLTGEMNQARNDRLVLESAYLQVLARKQSVDG